MKRMVRRSRNKAGFTLMEVLVAAAIMFSGAVVMITVLPELIAAGSKRTSRDISYSFANAKFADLEINSFAAIAASANGNFDSLLPNSDDASQFTWSYTSSSPSPGLLKRVNLVIKWADTSETFVMLIADTRND